MEATYGDTKISVVKSKKRKIYNYLGMVLDYTTPGKVQINMMDYIKKMVDEFPEKLDYEEVVNLAMQNYFVDINSTLLPPKQEEIFTPLLLKSYFYQREHGQISTPLFHSFALECRNQPSKTGTSSRD